MFHGHRGSVWEDEKVLETEGGDGHQTMRMYIMPQIMYLKMIKIVSFMLCK